MHLFSFFLGCERGACCLICEIKDKMSEISKIIKRFSEGVFQEKIGKKFAEWFESPDSREEKERCLKEVWNSIPEDSVPISEVEAAYVRFLARRGMAGKSGRKWSWIWKAAVAVLLPAASAFITWLAVGTGDDVRLVECHVPYGEKADLVLPDSSVVQLNAGSTLIYPERFGKVREVHLVGQARFSVRHDSRRQFVVNTSDMEVSVLGTEFNVTSYPDDGFSSAFLESGKVQVRFNALPDEKVILSPDDIVVYDRKSATFSKDISDPLSAVAWTEGGIACDGMSLQEVARVLERHFDVRIHVPQDKYQNNRLTFKCMSGDSLTDILNILGQLVPGLGFKAVDETLYIIY